MFRIKICGLTRREDVASAIRAGADALGFNFYPESPRYIEPAKAAELITQARQTAASWNLPKVTCVGVFVNASTSSMNKIAHQVGLDALQLHGDDVVERLDELPHHDCLAVLRIRALDDPKIESLAAAVRRPHVKGVLVDAYSPDAYGGTGHQVAWEWIPVLSRHWASLPTILAGGLKPENVASAIRMAKPFGIDVASGVESTPGIKAESLIRELVNAAQHAFQQSHQVANREAHQGDSTSDP